MATILWSLLDLFAQVVVIFYPGVFVFWMIVHNGIERLRPFGIRAYWVAAIAWGITTVPLLVFRRDLFSVRWSFAPPWSGFLPALGFAAFTFSVIVLSLASRQISMRVLIGLPEVEPHKNKQSVLRGGIYARTRNPIYLGHWLLIFSAAALSNFAANWIGFALDCLLLPLLIRAEERELLSRYGAGFAEYMRRVPRFFPRVKG
jgi:protein-S-isoprenylcysteine O-methyltransferase Ste14